MSHDEPLRECLEVREEFKKHKDESVSYRTKVDKHEIQLEQTMQDIKEIKLDLKEINENKFPAIERQLLQIKIWILSAAVAGLIVVSGQALYYGGMNKQVEVNTKRIDKLETHNVHD